MRTTAASLSITLVQLAGGLVVGLLFWLLLITHNVVAAPGAALPLTATTSGAVAGPAAPGSVAGYGEGMSGAGHGISGVPRWRSQQHAAYWQAREASRQRRAQRSSVLGLLLPRRSLHQRVEGERMKHRNPVGTTYERMHRKARERRWLGGLLGGGFPRNRGR